METNFPILQDINIAYSLLADYTNRHFPIIPYEKLITTEQETDEVHGEILEVDKRWDIPLSLRSYADPSKVMQPLTKFGVENIRFVDLYVAVPDLLEAGLATQDEDWSITLIAKPGDRFEYSKKKYSALTFIPSARFANTDVVLYYQIHSEVYRYSSDSWQG